MSNIFDIESLRKEFLAKQTTQDLQKFAEKQQLLLEEYIAKCKDLQDKISHLEEMLKHAPSALVIGSPSFQDEEALVVSQIKILQQRGISKELDINEVKKLDLLLKNLFQIRGVPKPKLEDIKDMRDVSPEKLLAIAKGE